MPHPDALLDQLPEPLRDSARRLLRAMRSDPAMADVPDAEKLDLVLSDAFRPILTFHAQSRARGGAQVVELQNRLQRNQDAQGAAPAPHLPRAASGY